MRVHHLNCGTLRPFGRRFINGDGLPFQTARLVCHCLLLETEGGLVLVDTGYGLGDTSTHRPRDRTTRYLTRPRLDPDETAVRQLTGLGFSTDDVTHIVMTHLDADHAGGLPDFPRAKVHVLEAEQRAAMSPSTSLDRFRYRAHHWAHGPEWVTHDGGSGDWFGFEAIRELRGLTDMALVPLPGHSRGHTGVAIRLDGSRWLLHAGDAYFFHGEVDPAAPHSTLGLARFQARVEVERAARKQNQQRLRELAGAHGDEVELVCSHDPVEFDRYG